MMRFLLPAALVALGESKVAFFWAVDDGAKTQEEVKKNIEYIKKTLNEPYEILFAHYKGKVSSWDPTWYKENIAHTITESGFKFHLLKSMWQAQQLSFDYVWALDSDIDLLTTDLNKFMKLVRNSKASLVSPTFSGPQTFTNYGSLLETDMDDARASLNDLGRPDDRYDYRLTNFVEMTAPMLSARACEVLFRDCADCVLKDVLPEWGLDRVWCGLTKVHIYNDAAASCAYIDAQPVNHLDWKTAQVTEDFRSIDVYMEEHYRDFWATPKVLGAAPRSAELSGLPQ